MFQAEAHVQYTNLGTKVGAGGSYDTSIGYYGMTLSGSGTFSYVLIQFINEDGHLPEIPSEAEVKAEGINVFEMNAKLLQKIEELTLYVIELKKEVEALKAKDK